MLTFKSVIFTLVRWRAINLEIWWAVKDTLNGSSKQRELKAAYKGASKLRQPLSRCLYVISLKM